MVASYAKTYSCTDDSRLRGFRAIQRSDAVMPCVIDTGLPFSFIRLRAPFKIYFLFPASGSIFVLLAPPCVFAGSYSLLSVYAMWYCTRVSYLLANLRQWFSRYTCSPEGNSKIREIKFRDTLPADRSLRFRALIGIGLMARDTLFYSSV